MNEDIFDVSDDDNPGGTTDEYDESFEDEEEAENVLNIKSIKSSPDRAPISISIAFNSTETDSNSRMTKLRRLS